MQTEKHRGHAAAAVAVVERAIRRRANDLERWAERQAHAMTEATQEATGLAHAGKRQGPQVHQHRHRDAIGEGSGGLTVRRLALRHGALAGDGPQADAGPDPTTPQEAAIGAPRNSAQPLPPASVRAVPAVSQARSST